jgi:hypothetical protein
MLTTVAVLIILLGLMVSLARYVRDQSAHQLTRDLLRDLDGMMAQYQENNHGALPAVAALLAADEVAASRVPDDATLLERARKNNNQWVELMRADYLLHQYRRDRMTPISPALATTPSPPQPPPMDPFDKYPITVYDPQRHTLRDAWGQPIVLMPRQHALIGLAPSRGGQDRYFFFSAGPDRRFLTREDNIYSYEAVGQSN